MNEKIENLLNVALSSSEVEESDSELMAGYDEEEKTWDLIVRYIGNLDFLEQYSRIRVTILSNNFAILTVPETLIERIANYPEIIYVEKPKPLYFEVTANRAEACVSSVQSQLGLYGEGVTIAIIDSGIDYFHPAFLDESGRTRIVSLWDQSEDGKPPLGFTRGSEYTQDEINEALQTGSRERGYEIVPSIDYSGHGTHVAGIAAGNFSEDRQNQVGYATKSQLLIVKLSTSKSRSFATTVELMEAVEYVVRKAKEEEYPLVINLSFGNNYGSHDGTSLLETYLDEVAARELVTLVIGSGNEGNAGGHIQGRIMTNESKEVQVAVAKYQTAFSIQIWKSYADIFQLEMISPSGIRTGILQDLNEVMKYQFPTDGVKLFVYYGTPKPYSIYQEIFLQLNPIETYINQGVWKILLYSEKSAIGEYNMWLPTESALSVPTRFVQPSADITLTIPSTTSRAITVGAYDSTLDSYADFSGRGFTRETNQIKPEIVAPGVGIISVAVGGGFTALSGTSMATPAVSGAAALLMEWGIVRKNDPYLYGQKVKAYLIRGARQLPSEKTPSKKTGFGALCLKESIPI